MKLQIINPPLTISNWTIKQGSSEVYKSPVSVSNSTYDHNQVYLVVNGQQVNIKSPDSPNIVNEAPYEFHYDCIYDYELMHGRSFDRVTISKQTLDYEIFWPGEMLEWFEQCESMVFAQNFDSTNWRFSFINHSDADKFRIKINTRRSHSFTLNVPTKMTLDSYYRIVKAWLQDNIESDKTVNTANGNVVVEVRDQTEAVKAKMILVSLNDSDNSEA